jgi:hypothetical protein
MASLGEGSLMTASSAGASVVDTSHIITGAAVTSPFSSMTGGGWSAHTSSPASTSLGFEKLTDEADPPSPVNELIAVGFVGLPVHAAVSDTTTPMVPNVPSKLIFMLSHFVPPL